MSDLAYRIMVLQYRLQDWVAPPREALERFHLAPGQVVVDYGCGPGRHLAEVSRRVGPTGKVYAVDVHPVAITEASARVRRLGLTNVEVMLAEPAHAPLPDALADVIYALDMFHAVREPTPWLREVRRLLKPGGVFYLEDGHQPRASTLAKLAASGAWQVTAETPQHIVCIPQQEAP